MKACRASLLLLAALLLASARPASAQDMSMGSPSAASGIGVGVESMLSGPSGPTIVYQAPSFHVEGILGVFDRETTTVLLAGRFYYQLHAGALSDFSLGGGLGLLNIERETGNDTDTHLEAGAKIRVFMAPNVALSSSLGLAVVLDQGSGSAILAGRLQGTMGITYFFF